MNHNSVVDFQVSRSQSLGTRSLWHRPLSSDQPWQPVAFPAKTLGRPVASISAIARLTNATTEFKTASGNLSNRTNNHATLSVRAPSAPDSAPLTHSSFHNSLPSCSVTDSGSIPASATESHLLCRILSHSVAKTELSVSVRAGLLRRILRRLLDGTSDVILDELLKKFTSNWL